MTNFVISDFYCFAQLEIISKHYFFVSPKMKMTERLAKRLYVQPKMMLDNIRKKQKKNDFSLFQYFRRQNSIKAES